MVTTTSEADTLATDDTALTTLRTSNVARLMAAMETPTTTVVVCAPGGGGGAGGGGAGGGGAGGGGAGGGGAGDGGGGDAGVPGVGPPGVGLPGVGPPGVLATHALPLSVWPAAHVAMAQSTPALVHVATFVSGHAVHSLVAPYGYSPSSHATAQAGPLEVMTLLRAAQDATHVTPSVSKYWLPVQAAVHTPPTTL